MIAQELVENKLDEAQIRSILGGVLITDRLFERMIPAELKQDLSMIETLRAKRAAWISKTIAKMTGEVAEISWAQDGNVVVGGKRS